MKRTRKPRNTRVYNSRKYADYGIPKRKPQYKKKSNKNKKENTESEPVIQTEYIQGQAKPSKDHTGKEYRSFIEMCRAYGKSRGCVQGRLNKGMSLEEALTKESEHIHTCTDHKGNDYSSFSAMCKAYCKCRVTVAARLKNGASLEDALTKEILPDTKTCKNSTDHKGNVYQSFKEMCEAYGKQAGLVRSRLRNGMSLEEALTRSVKSYNKKEKSHGK